MPWKEKSRDLFNFGTNKYKDWLIWFLGDVLPPNDNDGILIIRQLNTYLTAEKDKLDVLWNYISHEFSLFIMYPVQVNRFFPLSGFSKDAYYLQMSCLWIVKLNI